MRCSEEWEAGHSGRVVYDPEVKPLWIVRLIHGARDLGRLFGSQQ